MRRCLFCGCIGRLTREHAFPAWLHRELGDGTAGAVEVQFGHAATPQHWLRRPVMTKRCCGKCNHGWMSELEAKAKGIITPRMADLICDFDRQDQECIAAWSVKTAMVFDALSGSRVSFYTADERHELRETLTPPLGTGVWIGRWAQSRTSYGHARLLENPHAAYGNGYATTFGLGHFVVQILTIRPIRGGVKELRLHSRPPWVTRLHQLWPIQRHRLPWPPADSFSDSNVTLDQLSERFKGA